jgi:hypothetical protein
VLTVQREERNVKVRNNNISLPTHAHLRPGALWVFSVKFF